MLLIELPLYTVPKLLVMFLRSENAELPAISIKQRMLQSLAVVATVDGELVSPEGTKEGKNASI